MLLPPDPLLTDDVFLSVQVQCEYEAADLQRAADLRSLYAATNPPPVVALGTISVHMRLATGVK